MTNEALRVGILTSGGDAPGMNAAVRALVRSGHKSGVKIYGIRHGYEGLLNTDIYEMTAQRVSDIIHRGGTILRTARSAAMMTEEGQHKAADVVKVLKFNALVAIGGDGTFRGAFDISKQDVNVIGIPATIDLDMPCTEYSLGFDTAVNTGMDAINRLRDTSFSHERCSVVEVMGRDAGYLALWCGLTGGAEEVIFPENGGVDAEVVIQEIIKNRSLGKRNHLIVVAEGIGGSAALAKEIESKLGIESRPMILGHLQRGGSPTALDRMHGSTMGFLAMEAIVSGEKNKAVIFKEGRHKLMDLEEAINCKREYTAEMRTMHEMVKSLAV